MSHLKRGLFVIIFAIIVTIGLSSSIGIHTSPTNTVTEEIEPDQEPSDFKIIEPELQYVTSAAGSDYVDGVHSLTYGSHSNVPPNGMGKNDATSTDLTESNAVWERLMTQTTFNTKPTGWVDSGISYNGDFSNDGTATSGYLYCTSIDTSTAGTIRFTLSIGVFKLSGSFSVRCEFLDSSGNWDEIGSYPLASKADVSFSSSDSQYMHSSFKVRIYYTGTSSESGVFSADNWRIDTAGTNDVLLKQQALFNSLPSGWTDFGITYSGGTFSNNGINTDGYLYCNAVDTSAYNGVKFILSIGVFKLSGSFSVRCDFLDSSGNWVEIGSYPLDSKADVTFSSFDSQYLHSNFKVRVYYTGSSSESGSFTADNWRIYGIEPAPYASFKAVYVFNSVDFGTYASEKLVVDFDTSSSSEYLDFRLECGDTTPDNLVADNKNTDFEVDIDTYLTGSTCYVEITDDFVIGDLDIDTWLIDQMYILLTNSDPVNDAVPSSSNLDDTDNLYAEYKTYQITTSHIDNDGYQHIDTVDLQCQSNDRATTYWTVRYDEDTNTFIEQSDTQNYIELDTGSSTATRSGVNLDLVFYIRIRWNHPAVTNIDLVLTTKDADAATDTDYYEVNWDIESRLDFSSFSLGDQSDVASRGPIGGTIEATGAVVYYGSSIHPNASEVDVWIGSSDVSPGEWAATNYESTGGTFSVTVPADDTVGLDTYDFKVVTESSGYSGTDLLHAVHSSTYIADQIICSSISSPSFIVDSSATGYIDVYLQYVYDNTAVTDGTYSLNGLSLSHQGGGVWRASNTPNSPTYVTYDNVSIDTVDSYGIDTIDMNAQSITIYWESINCYISTPLQDPIRVGENATGIHVWGEYTYWALHGFRYYDGTINLNNTQFMYDTIGTRGYKIISIGGDDAFGITTFIGHNETSCTWIYEPPQWNPEPSDQVVELGNTFEYALSVIAPGGVDHWWINDTTHFVISPSGVVTNASKLSLGVYYIQVWINNTQNDTITSIFSVTVQDTLPPVWLVVPEDQIFDSITGLTYQLHAFDQSGIDTWWLNDTTFFVVSTTGIITNATFVVSGDYCLTIYVNDTLGHITTAVIKMTVYDDTLPTWAEEPNDFIVEYGETLHYILSVNAPVNVSTYWVNDTTNFSVDDKGVITSTGFLDVGDYPLHIWVNDTWGRTISAEIVIHVVDTTAPSWVSTPKDISIESSASIDCRYSATDLSGISRWTVDDTIRFAITNQGWLFNLTTLPDGTYPLVITVFDTYDNNRSMAIQIVITAAMPPSWDFIPDDRVLELGEDFYYQLGAEDMSGIGEWWLNSTKYFSIDEDGLVVNKIDLEVGVYGITVYVSDTLGHTNSTSFRVTVRDTTPPEWEEAPPRTVLVLEGESIGFDLDASDLSTPLTWTVNDTTRFLVNGTGYVMGIAELEPETYWILITVSDIFGNNRTAEIAIIVTPNPTSDDSMPIWLPMILISIGIGGMVVIVIVIFKVKGRV